MTDREIIIHLAEKVMGWEVKANDFTGNTIAVDKLDGGNGVHLFGKFPNLRDWNPLESIADAFEVQAKVLEGPHAKKYGLRIYDAVTNGMTVIGTQRLYQSLLAATPRQRCLAAVEATR